MKPTDLHKAIMHRDNCSLEEANELIQIMVDDVASGENPEEVLHNEGYEPDYVFDILPF